ncbi:hypothetical protein F7725_020288 [Dissostichus mawsoni]|uniref:Uncharacterized protein n=1 Tax=Dissostichus mawsoni TaxID=36200 RepID=A0A7J5YCV7_DISMA|nr:hypothetical protein F7725_020288 [Dissostichus mawsoni]
MKDEQGSVTSGGVTVSEVIHTDVFHCDHREGAAFTPSVRATRLEGLLRGPYLIKDEDWALLVGGGLFLIILFLGRVHRLLTGTRSTSLSPVNNISLEASL